MPTQCTWVHRAAWASMMVRLAATGWKYLETVLSLKLECQLANSATWTGHLATPAT
jgi:hypothetical protein